MLAEAAKLKCAQEVIGLSLGLNTDYLRNGSDGFAKFPEANVVTAYQLGHNRLLPHTSQFTIH
jgi:hypothetical protein